MPLDSIALRAIIGELEPQITGAKIDKVQQPDRDTIVLSLRGVGHNSRLLICAGTGSARIHFTETAMENPQSPPMFCMLLRKHLVGARINAVSQPYMDRLAVFDIGAYDELGSAETKRLVVEMMGAGSNIILIGDDGRIIDCLRRMGSPTEDGRAVLPGLLYREPPRRYSRSLMDSSETEISELVSAERSGADTEKWLTGTFLELSPLISRELLRRAGIESGSAVGELTDDERGRLAFVLTALRAAALENELAPYMIYLGERPRDFSFMPVGVYGGDSRSELCGSFSTMLDEYYTRRDIEAGMRRRSADLLKTVKNLRDRRARTLERQRADLVESGDRESYRRSGDLITANIFRIKKGDKFVEAEDYYDESGEAPLVKIELDVRKTPQQNAAVFYKKYTKLKTAIEHLTLQIERGETELLYLNSVLDEIERAESVLDIAEVRRELVDAGYLKQSAAKKREKSSTRSPVMAKSSSGFEIRIGRNNRQNDLLTFRESSKRDMWLHAQKIHGSHVIIKCDGHEPDEGTILEAAKLAARHSAARNGGKIPVDYTLVRNVKKPNGALPGMVIYTDYKTIIVDSDDRA